jgi:mono/diheme cytochrome c family protein
VFQNRCAPCHGAGRGGDPGRELLPGTDALRIKYQGRVPALLEQRTDLPEAVLRVFVRHGSWSMPAFRKTELSDADIANIAVYLAVSSRGASR